jgi:predicted DNA-binding transcriptional regulator AlpA
MELLNIEECAAMLKVSPRAIYEMTSRRGRQRTEYPLPVVRLNSKCLRFLRSDVEKWISKLAEGNE